MLSLGMFSFLPARIAVRRRGLELGSPPPTRAAMVISRITLVKARPRLASVAAFLCLIVAHLECPDIARLALEFAENHRATPSEEVRRAAPLRCHASLAQPCAGTVQASLRDSATRANSVGMADSLLS